MVLIAGKGHEKEQILADRTIPFDDVRDGTIGAGRIGLWWRAMKLTLAEAAIGAGAVLEAPPALRTRAAMVHGYSIDSRTVAPGELFFAVRGDRLDGHDFVALGSSAGRWPRWFSGRSWHLCPTLRWVRRC